MTLRNLISCMNRSLQTENKVPSIPPGMSTKNSSQQSVTLGTNAGLIYCGLWWPVPCLPHCRPNLQGMGMSY